MKKIMSLLLSMLLVVELIPNCYAVETPTLVEGSGTEETPFLISSAEGLLYYFDYQAMLNEGADPETANVTYAVLTEDIHFDQISLEKTEMNEFCFLAENFYGVLDGGNHSIFGLVQEGKRAEFVHQNFGVIKNLIFKDCSFASELPSAAIVYSNFGLIQQIVLDKSVIFGTVGPAHWPLPGNSESQAVNGYFVRTNYGEILECVNLSQGASIFFEDEYELYAICVSNFGTIDSFVNASPVKNEGFVKYNGGTIRNCVDLLTGEYSELEELVPIDEFLSSGFSASMTSATGISWVATECGTVPATVSNHLINYTRDELLASNESGNPIQPPDVPAELPDAGELPDSDESFTPTKPDETLPPQRNLMDVKQTDWFAEAVYSCVHNGIINGYPDGTFGPNNHLTRAEAVKLIVSANGINVGEFTDGVFCDTVNHWASSYISAAANAGFANGYPDGTFEPDAPISRAELVRLIVAAWEFLESEMMPFTDCGEHWANKEISAAYSNGIINGYHDGTFLPDNYITRAEAAKMISEVIKVA